MVSAGLAAGSLALPARAFAQVSAASPLDRQVLAIVQQQIARAGAVLLQRDIAAVADFAPHSSQPRFHFASLEGGWVRSFRVAHGSGSDQEHDGYLKWFSNVRGSNATSRGAYMTWEVYDGAYGPSLRLGSLDPDNSNVFDRAIVMHPADYCTEAHLAKWGRLGRSNGCFAMSPADFGTALALMPGGRMIYADRLGLG